LVLARLQKKTKRKTSRKVKSNQMTTLIGEDKILKEKLKTQTLFVIVDKLEQRIATLEKVLDSHAKCIGQLREDNNGN
jgi:hypothetical protein